MSKPIFTNNSKTELSVDFSRDLTCTYRCPYCYVNTTVNMYKHYEPKIVSNTNMAKNSPVAFSAALNEEYRQQGNQNLPIRIYGSGDYLPEHYNFLKLLNFKFYIISKSLAQSAYIKELRKVLDLSNCISIVLSIDKYTITNKKHAFRMKRLYAKKHNKVKLCFTGTPADFTRLRNRAKFDIFFNIKKTDQSKLASQNFKQSCPCSTGASTSKGACLTCTKCK